jgi:hypothetical protein
MPTVPQDVWIPIHPPDVSQCPHVSLTPLANVVPWRGPPPPSLQAWAASLLKYPLGTVVRDTLAGLPIVARIECHDFYGAHPERPPTWHKGASVYRPAERDPSTGRLTAVTSPSAGWPGSAA